MKLRNAIVLVVLAMICNTTLACDITLSPGATATSINSAFSSHNEVCLTAGSYTLGTQEIFVPSGKTLRGTGATPSDTTLNTIADRAISLADSSLVRNFKLVGPGGAYSTYGIIIYHVTDATIWSLDIQGFRINIGVNGSANTHIWNTFLSNNGNISNSVAEPNIWISSSPGTEILYGAVTGRANKPFGDGEVSCYNSEGIYIKGLQSFDSGTSAFYLVNCDNAIIENAKIYRAGGFGLDIVGGTDNFISRNNLVQWSWYAGSVYDNVQNSNGQYINTSFVSNNVSQDTRFCSGIYLSGAGAAPVTTGSTATPAPLICP